MDSKSGMMARPSIGSRASPLANPASLSSSATSSMSEKLCALEMIAFSIALGAEPRTHRRGFAEHREFLLGALGIAGERRRQQARDAQFAREQLDARRLVESAIVVANPGGGEQLGATVSSCTSLFWRKSIGAR